MAQPQKTDLLAVFKASAPAIRKLASKHVNIERLMSLALEARARTPLLAQCSIESMVQFCKTCAQWGTDRVGAGGVWPVPFKNKNTGQYEMQAIPDWRLLIGKAKAAGVITHASADIVREGDVFRVVRGLHPDLIHEPVLGSTKPVVAAYCRYILPDGTSDFEVMDAPQLDKIERSSKARDSGPWKDWSEEMKRKTVVRRAMKQFQGAESANALNQMIEADDRVVGLDLDMPEPISMPVLTEATETTEPPQGQAEPQASQSAPPATQNLDTRPISEPQQKRLFAIMRGAGVDEPTLKTYLINTYNIGHTKEIQRHQYEAICAWVESQARQPGEEG